MNDKINPYAEQHARATKRTPSRQYPANTYVGDDAAEDNYHRDMEYAMESLIGDYQNQHGELPPDDWTPPVYWFGIMNVAHPFDPDDWAECILSECVEEVAPPRAEKLAEDIINNYYENAHEDWEQGWDDKDEIIQALAPALAYAERFGEFGDRAELARLLAPVGKITDAWFLGYESDYSHAIDIEPEHLRAEIAKWCKGARWEDLIDDDEAEP